MLKIARSLRNKGYSVEHGYELGSVKKQMSRASKLGSRTTLILGPDEIARDEVVEKCMESGEEKRISLSTILE
jgi:histidyl-tRNA synthetase